MVTRSDDGGAERVVASLRAYGRRCTSAATESEHSVAAVGATHALELGAGCSGLPGMVLAQLGLFARVLLTDGDEEAVERLQMNVADNAPALAPPADARAVCAVEAQLLRWGHDDDIRSASDFIRRGISPPDAGSTAPHDGQFHVIVCADVAYRMTPADPGAAAAVAALCETLRRLLAPGGIILLSQMARPLHEEAVLLSALLAEYDMRRVDEPERPEAAAATSSDGVRDNDASTAPQAKAFGLGVFQLQPRAEAVRT